MFAPIMFQAMGADPEVFLVDENGHPVSAEGLIGGTKEKPQAMVGLPKGFFVQEDNVAAEYNIPPAATAEEFSNNIVIGLRYIAALAMKKKLKVKVQAAFHFTPEQLDTPHARRLGCDPDLNLWDLMYNPAPVPPATLRTAAGHVHFSWKDPQKDQKIILARTLDVYLGLASILVTPKTERRTLYGKAGAVRDKEYGLEYRTLDNFWISKAQWRKTVFQNGFLAIQRVNEEGDFWAEELEHIGRDVRHAINEHDTSMATDLLKDVGGVPLFTAG